MVVVSDFLPVIKTVVTIVTNSRFIELRTLDDVSKTELIGKGKKGEGTAMTFDKLLPHPVYKGFWKASCSAVAVCRPHGPTHI